MRFLKRFIILIGFPVVVLGVSGWKEYPAGIPPGFWFVYDVTVNTTGFGYAFAHDRNTTGKEYGLRLNNGVWSHCPSPPVKVARPSISADGTVYTVGDSGTGAVYRFEGNYWKAVALPERFALRTFRRVAAVGPHEFWAEGTTPEGFEVVVYFQNDEPYRVFNLGQLIEPHSSATASMVVPRVGGVSGECYVAVQASNNPFNRNRWTLFILRGYGTINPYAFPLEYYYCDGLAAYNPGDVRVMLTANSGAESRLYGFAGGTFREICVFPERVALDSYPTPSDGWGWHYPNRIYHWSGGAVSPATDINNAEILDLSMVGSTEGWAAGCKVINGERTATLWHYSDVEPSLTPTSLGRVKAAFR